MQKIVLIIILVLPLTNLHQGIRPESRDHHGMTYDSFRKKLVVYGGNSNSNSRKLFNQIWEWDGQDWQKPINGISEGRSSHVFIFDPSQKKSIFFGGVTSEGLANNDISLWDGNDWILSNKGPSSRYSPAIAYDENRQVIVMFSGSGKGEDGMWECRNGIWNEIKLDSGPQPSSRIRAQMAYDYANEAILLFGGYSNGESVGDTWQWDGENWKEIQITGPGVRNNHVMVTDKDRKRIVLFGGKNRQQNKLYGETWEWDGYKWEKKSNEGPQPRDMAAAAYDENLKEVVLFGGRNKDRESLGDIWTWNGEEWKKHE